MMPIPELGKGLKVVGRFFVQPVHGKSTETKNRW